MQLIHTIIKNIDLRDSELIIEGLIEKHSEITHILYTLCCDDVMLHKGEIQPL